MKRFLQKLASSVLRPQPNLHPFAESIFPRPFHASLERSIQAQEINVATSRNEQSASQPAPLLQGLTFTPARSPQSEVQSWPSAPGSSAREENIAGHEQSFRPLLPVRQAESSYAADVISPRNQRTDVASAVRSDSRTDSTHEKERVTGDSAIGHVTTVNLAQDESRASQQASLHSQFDVLSLQALRKPAQAAAPFVPRTQGDPSASGDIRISIGRIEVIAVPPPTPRSTPSGARKEISLDEYLSRQDRRVG
jgi:hypothetical protein